MNVKILFLLYIILFSSILTAEVISPDSLSGLRLWLKSDELTQANGTQINTWADSSGNNNDAVAILAAPIKDEVTINVSGGTNTFSIAKFSSNTLDLLRAENIFNNSLVTNGTIIAIYRVDTSSTGIGRPLGFGSYRYTSGNTNWNLGPDPSLRFDGSYINTGYQQTHALNEFILRSSTKNGQNFTEWFDGNLALATVTHSSSLSIVDEFYLGDVRQDSGAETLNQDIAEVLVFDRVLSNSERQGVEAYLNQKFFVSNIPELSSAQRRKFTLDNIR